MLPSDNVHGYAKRVYVRTTSQEDSMCIDSEVERLRSLEQEAFQWVIERMNACE